MVKVIHEESKPHVSNILSNISPDVEDRIGNIIAEKQQQAVRVS